ncbi:MAG: hypothetical protein V4611_03715 [Patescibacteria group bacterium]
MFKEIVADHRPWVGSTASEIGYAGLESQTALHTYAHTDGSTYDVLVIDGRQNGEGRTILKSTSLDYRINPFLIRQETINATKLGARMAIAEIPGMSGIPLDSHGNLDLSIDIDEKMSTVRQTKQEFLQVRRGAFDLLAQKQLTAFIDILNLSEYDPVEIGGHSLGATMAATMGRVAAKEQLSIPLTIDRIHLDDPSNFFGLSAIDIAQNINDGRKETKRRNEVYFKENEQIGHGDITAFERLSAETARISKYIKGQQKSVVLNCLQATRWGIQPILSEFIEEGMKNGTVTPETVVSIAHYKDSLASKISAARALHDIILSSGIRSQIFEYISASDDPTELGHQTLASLGRAASIAIDTPQS